MRACARVALVLMALSATFGLAGCAAIDELRDTILRWVESEKLPSGHGAFADDLPDATPVVPPEKPAKKEASKRTNQRANCNGPRAFCFLQRNHRSPHPPRRRGRTKLRGNPRRPLRCDCALLFPKRRRREFFHAEIGHRSWIPADVLIDLVQSGLALARNVRLEDEDGAVEVTTLWITEAGQRVLAARG